MSEHRKIERKKLMAFTPVYDAHQNVLLGYIGDLSLQGVMVIGEKQIEIDQQVTLLLDFPATPEFPARRVRIPARSAWCRHEPSAEYFNTGFEFQRIDPQYKEYFEAILVSYQFRRATLH